MAYVKPLKMTERGFTKEISSSEDVQLGNVSLGGSISSASLSVSGSSSLSSLAVSGASTFTGNVSAGNVAASGSLSAGASSLSSLSVSGSSSLNSLGVSGASTFTGNISAGNVAASGSLSAGATSLSSLGVSGASTFTGNISAGNVAASGSLSAGATSVSSLSSSGLISGSAGISITGAESTFSSATVSDLTNTRIVFAGTSGALQDSASLVWDGSDLIAASAKVSDLTNGRVTYAGASGALIDSANLTFDGTDLTMASAKVSDLTSGRIVVAGASGALADDGYLTFSGNVFSVGSVQISASTGRISGLTDPSSAQDAVTKSYADNLAAGLDVKGSCRAATTGPITLSGAQTIDGVSIVAGDRVLVKNQGSSWANGIYVAAAGAWDRSSDMDAWSEFPAAFFFIEEGTAYHDTGWVCIVDQGGTIGTTAVQFTQFSGAGAVTSGDGITVSGTQVSVNLKDADPGLEFVSSELAVKLNDTNPALSLSSGLAVTLSGTTLDKDASGLKVLGLPSAFTIAGTAVSSDFSAANANILVGGTATSAGNASSLITLNNVAVWSCSADGSISAGQPVYISSGSKVKKAQAQNAGGSDNDGFVVGVVMSSVSDGQTAKVITSGIAPGILSGATAGSPMYLDTTGGLTSNPADVGSGERFVMIGVAMNSSDLWVQVRDFGQKA